MTPTQRIGSSVEPTASAQVRLRRRDGLLTERRGMKREVTLLHGAEQLGGAGTLGSPRTADASGESDGARSFAKYVAWANREEGGMRLRSPGPSDEEAPWRR